MRIGRRSASKSYALFRSSEAGSEKPSPCAAILESPPDQPHESIRQSRFNRVIILLGIIQKVCQRTRRHKIPHNHSNGNFHKKPSLLYPVRPHILILSKERENAGLNGAGGLLSPSLLIQRRFSKVPFYAPAVLVFWKQQPDEGKYPEYTAVLSIGISWYDTAYISCLLRTAWSQ